jgi:hypothetical protein
MVCLRKDEIQAITITSALRTEAHIEQSLEVKISEIHRWRSQPTLTPARPPVRSVDFGN